jgi:SET domain-containing protein
MASFTNHSCLHNAQHSFIDDIVIVRATKDIPAGTEILIRYRERTTDFPKAAQASERFESSHPLFSHSR